MNVKLGSKPPWVSLSKRSRGRSIPIAGECIRYRRQLIEKASAKSAVVSSRTRFIRFTRAPFVCFRIAIQNSVGAVVATTDRIIIISLSRMRLSHRQNKCVTDRQGGLFFGHAPVFPKIFVFPIHLNLKIPGVPRARDVGISEHGLDDLG